MSDISYLKCKCGEWSEDSDTKFPKDLIRAVKISHPLYLAAKAGWDVWDATLINGFAPKVACFLCHHFEHGGFYVVKSSDKNAAEFVTPDVPNYDAVCLPHAEREVIKAIDHYRQIAERITPEGR